MSKSRFDHLTPTKLFLIDAIGALMSACFLGILLIRIQEYIGMPENVLFSLAIIALLLAAYSISCYFLTPANWRQFLKLLAILNILYCCLTVWLMIIYFNQLTMLGLSYFIVEVLILLWLIRLEWKLSTKS